LVPDISQKGVDLRIGLDIATLAFRRIVDTIVVVAGDSDLVPAFKLARREGLRVYLVTYGHNVTSELSAHVDDMLECTFSPTNSHHPESPSPDQEKPAWERRKV
jgi:uncharacterized LabA/DUF88 family protein